jgi:hypothetical protein
MVINALWAEAEIFYVFISFCEINGFHAHFNRFKPGTGGSCLEP